ncbi:serine/threonine-protein kinase [Fuerstiella marisgermanici]|uniref:Serine/threonine-protein kinase PknB n=1 Tax=Fuerstiella marisgermanici TaxID=1891926 RepID=A0A1P8WND3_9PLAN|nr:serine/threonine-protein kinase [Fuerstiella marisgermanici]APZ95555.1 Serine/threonine-protein kinase PknB [Fuerstiella marisgermanici]
MTTKLKINCPSCDQKLRVSEEKLTLQVCCPKCKQRFVPQTAANTTRSGHELQQTIISNDRVSELLPSPTESRKTIGRFLIKDKLGEGAFGAVYKAHDLQLERTVAIKVPTFAPGDLRRRRRFVTEARSAAKLHHPNIVTVYENGETEDGQLYIASEFVAGKTLKEVLKTSESVLTQRVTWVRDLAEALHYAHSEGIVHRDIKPENVLIDDTATRAKVADFGLAKVLDEQGSSEKAELKTQDGILGTPAFMAPEQARGKLNEVGPHSDQYSLGAVLYQCLTGQPPFFGSTYVVVAAVAGDTEPISIRNISPSVPLDLVAICENGDEQIRQVAVQGLRGTC